MSTLRYADRAKQIKNKPKINEDPKDAMLRGFKNELDELKMQLAAMGQPVDGLIPGAAGGAASSAVKAEREAKRRREKHRSALDSEAKRLKDKLATIDSQRRDMGAAEEAERQGMEKLAADLKSQFEDLEREKRQLRKERKERQRRKRQLEEEVRGRMDDLNAQMNVTRQVEGRRAERKREMKALASKLSEQDTKVRVILILFFQSIYNSILHLFNTIY